MRDGIVARKYAETLFELGLRNDQPELYGEAIRAVADLLETEPKFRLFLETPRIDDASKKALVKEVFGSELPRHVVNFVRVTIDKRRQRLLGDIAAGYAALLDG